MYDGVDANKFQFKQNKAFGDAVKLVMTGFVSEIKGQIQVINAISLLNDTEQKRISFDIYGQGAYEYIQYLKLYIKKKKIKAGIRFKGQVDNLHELLPEYDIGFNCSRSEGFGLVTIEYMLCGVPVIAARRGANIELIKDGETGMLYKYNDIVGLKNAICKIINDKELRNRVCKNAYERAKTEFTINENAKRIYELYVSMI